MPDWALRVLVGVFAVHLLLFGRLWIRRRQAYYGIVSLTFLLLVVSFSLRLRASTLQVDGIAVYTLLRMMAWMTAAISAGLLVRRRWRARPTSTAQGPLLSQPDDAVDEEVDTRH